VSKIFERHEEHPMKTGSQKRAGAASPIARGKLEILPTCVGEALLKDYEDARDRLALQGISADELTAAIGKLCNVTGWAVRKWFEAGKYHRWPCDQVEAVVRVTGGAHYCAYMRRLGAPALLTGEIPAEEIVEDLAAATEETARLTRRVAREAGQADEDTPGVLDRAERMEISAGIEKQVATLEVIRTKVEGEYAVGGETGAVGA
jgi:hypothetical protein